MKRDILLKSILSIFFFIGIMLLESACNDDDGCNGCGSVGSNYEISSFDSVSMQTYGLSNSNPDTAKIKEFYLLLHYSTEKIVGTSTLNFSCYATPPMPYPRLKYNFDSIQIISNNPSFQLADSNWYLPNLYRSLGRLNTEIKDFNENYFDDYFIFQINNYAIENPITTSFKVLVYKEDAIIFEEETKSITLIP